MGGSRSNSFDRDAQLVPGAPFHAHLTAGQPIAIISNYKVKSLWTSVPGRSPPLLKQNLRFLMTSCEAPAASGVEIGGYWGIIGAY